MTEATKFEAIGEYPNTPFKKGDIIEMKSDYRGVGYTFGEGVWESQSFFEDYPNIFRNLSESKEDDIIVDEGYDNLLEEATDLMTTLLPPQDYGENVDCERLYDIIKYLYNRK